jgi:hypothetical protein
MTDEELKKIVQQGMEAELEEVERILAAIDADPVLRNVQAPPELREKVFAQIREYEEQKRLEQLSEEDREYIRLGKIYRKRRKWNKVAVLIAAAIAVLALGTVSMGEEKNILSFLKQIISGGERTTSDSGSTEPVLYDSEEELYEEIEKEYGFIPVKLDYLPQGLGFKEAVFGADIQSIYMYYGTKNSTDITYNIRPNYRDSSFVTVIEDDKIQEYMMNVNGIEISLTEYNIEESNENRWSILWTYEEVQYTLNITDMKQAEVEKIINTLGFLSN